MNQRWHQGRDRYRPAGEPIDTRHYEVAGIDGDATAKAFVLTHHYSGTYPAARFRFGLYGRSGRLAGVAVFSHPANNRVLTNTFPCPALAAVELGRFVLTDDVPGNGETWFLGRCFAALRREGLEGVVSFSDPTARTTADGATVFGGHVGTIYQAHNGIYLGRGTSRVLRVLPDGSVLSARAISKLRAGDRGWRHVAELLVRYGAPKPTADLREWAAQWVPVLTRPLRHPGNHKYAWGLATATRRSLPDTLPFPKQTDPTRRAA